MGMRKMEAQNVRKLAKLGKKSIGLTLPIEMVRQLGWKEKQKSDGCQKQGVFGG